MCRKGQEGFAQAASAVSDLHLRKMLGEYAEQRAQFALQLQALVVRVATEPVTDLNVCGAPECGWTGLEAAISRGSESAILDECARADDTALETYNKALGHELPPKACELLTAQRRQVEEVRGQIAELRAHLGSRTALR